VRPNLGRARLGQMLSTPFERWAYMHYEIQFFRLKDRAAARYGPNDGPPVYTCTHTYTTTYVILYDAHYMTIW
jgi:hypothetical protein